MPVKESYVQELVQLLLRSDYESFMKHVRDDIEWMVINPEVKSTPLSGIFHSKKEFMENVGPLLSVFKAPTKFELQRLTVTGNLAFLELRGEAVGSKDNRELVGFWCMIYEFEETNDEEPQIKKIKEYMDSALAKEFIENNL